MSNLEYSDRDCTVYVGSIGQKVTEEIIFELFLQVCLSDTTIVDKILNLDHKPITTILYCLFNVALHWGSFCRVDCHKTIRMQPFTSNIASLVMGWYQSSPIWTLVILLKKDSKVLFTEMVHFSIGSMRRNCSVQLLYCFIIQI